MSGNSMPVSDMARRRVSSCAGVMSTPTGRAPRIASRAEKICGAAAELDDLDTVDLAEDSDVVLVNAEDAPCDVPWSAMHYRRCCR